MSAVPEIRAITEKGVIAALEEIRTSMAQAGSGKSDVIVEVVLRHARLLSELDEGAERPLLVLIGGASEQVQLDLVSALFATINGQAERFRELIEVLTPESAVLPAATVEQARRNAEARAGFLGEFPTASSAEVAERSGSRAKNKAALANQWRSQQKVFAVPVGREQRYPVFQFADENGDPKPAVAQVLAALERAGLSGWEIALWWTGALDELDDQRPVDLLDSKPERVVAAAEAVDDFPD